MWKYYIIECPKKLVSFTFKGKCGLLFYLFIISQNNCEKNYTFFKFFLIDNEKGIPYFKFAPLDYGYSGVYLQTCKVTRNPTLLIALFFCLKVGMSKND